MVNEKQINTLSLDQVEVFKGFAKEQTFNTRTQIIYHGQIPMAAYLLLSGEIILNNSRGKKIKNCCKNCLLGFQEILNNTPFRYTAEITEGSKVLILDRTEIKNISEQILGTEAKIC